MSKDMLGQVVRALVSCDKQDLGLVLDIVNKLNFGDRDAWRRHLATQVRRGPQRYRSAPEVDSIVHVDRSVKPVYPHWVVDVLHPELELSGPAEFDLSKDVELWLHDGQKNGNRITSQAVYEHLKSGNTLDSHLNLADLLAIQALGMETFCQYFSDKVVLAWKSVVRHRSGRLRMPYLFQHHNRVTLDWDWFGTDLYLFEDYPGLRFVSQN
jgi:hypothetical protein